MSRRLLVFLTLLFSLSASAATLPIVDGSIVVQYGDSITDAKKYSCYLESFYVMRHPTWTLHFRTEGRGGSTLTEAIDRHDRRVIGYLPNIVTVMFTPNGASTTNQFYTDLVTLTQNKIVATNSATPILWGVHPLDKADGDTDMGQRNVMHDAVGTDLGYQHVNLWQYLIGPYSNNFAAGHPIDLGWADVTHPGSAGHLTIAYALLDLMGEDGLVSTAAINATGGTVIYQTNCTISTVVSTATNLTFSRLDTKLPMCWDDSAAAGITMFPGIITNLNRYMLVVSNLTSGDYRVKIDGIIVATNTAAELLAGINLTSHTNGPIYDQRKEVLGRIRDKHGVDRVTLSALSPNKGIQRYKSNADNGYNNLGYRGQQLIDYLVPAVTEVNGLDALIKTAVQPATRTFVVETTAITPPASGPYVPPIGIPAPPFGINEVLPSLAPWTSAITNRYYIDNQHPSATDTSNPNGWPAQPRLTIPTGTSFLYPEGSIIIVTNGPYFPGASSTYTLHFSTNGSAANPTYMFGFGTNGATGNKAHLRDKGMLVDGRYFIIDGFFFEGVSNRCRVATVTASTPDHWAVRNCEFTDPDAENGAAIAPGGTYCVVYNNYCHHNGDHTTASQDDVASVQVHDEMHYIWILDNDLGFSAGDSLGVNSGINPSDIASFIYVGRNRMHDNKENAIDIKTCQDLIFSENECYNFPHGAGGGGEPAIVNDENQPDLGDSRIWLILNRCYNSGVSGIRVQSWANVYGNLIYNISSNASTVPVDGNGFAAWGNFNEWFECNTIYGADRAVNIFGGNTSTRHELRNNIYYNLRNVPHTFSVANVALTNSVMANSLFPATGLSIEFGSTYTSIPAIEAAQSTYWSGNVQGDPLFVNPTSHQYELLQGSPAIDTGIAPEIPDKFFAQYGLNISVDINHVTRPQNGAWDMGAFEFDASVLPVSKVALTGNAKLTGRVRLGQ